MEQMPTGQGYMHHSRKHGGAYAYNNFNGGPHHGSFGGPAMMYNPPLDPRMRINPGFQGPSQGYYNHAFQQPYGYFTEVAPSPMGAPIGPAFGAPNGRQRANSRSSGSSATNSGSDPDGEEHKGSDAVPRTAGDPFLAVMGTDNYELGYEEAIGPDEVLPLVSEESERPRFARRDSDFTPNPNYKGKRRPNNQGSDSQSTKHRKPGNRREQVETYTLKNLPSDDESEVPKDFDHRTPMATLLDEEYRDVFQQLNDRFCRASYRWLARYKFRIPKKSFMRDHLAPGDRELTEYVQIIKSLIEGREVPRNSVRDERINELVSVMEGASEIRHVTIHVSRKHKPDQRVLGFIAAVSEFCWILKDERSAAETNRLYEKIDGITRTRQLERKQRIAAATCEA